MEKMDAFNLANRNLRPSNTSEQWTTAPRSLFFPSPESTAMNTEPASQTPRAKGRTLSDSGPTLIPSPRFNEGPSKLTRDDHNLICTPSRTPRHVDLSSRGLILQMPARDTTPPGSTNLRIPTAPTSPQVESREPREPYESPSNVLPRHSRGLDFSRAATNLHHSTLVDQSSPDLSPTITQKTMFPPSRRASTHSMAMDSPRSSSNWPWIFNNGNAERGAFARSVASTNAMTSDASSDTSDEEDVVMRQDDPDESMITTPLVRKTEDWNAVTPFAHPNSTINNSNGWMTNYSPSAPAFSTFRSGRQPSTQSRKSSDSAVMSPQLRPTITNESQASYFGSDTAMTSIPSRRESVNMAAAEPSDVSTCRNESVDENAFAMAPAPATPGVIRRPVTRRSNMLPKSKSFARIRQMLHEESAPVDSEVKREAEVVRQVRVNEAGVDKPTPGTEPSSPNLAPAIPKLQRETSEISEIDPFGFKDPEPLMRNGSDSDIKPGSLSRELRSFLYRRNRTPPPSMMNRGRSSSGVSEDMNTGSPKPGTPPAPHYAVNTMGKISTEGVREEMDSFAESPAFQTPSAPTIAEISRKGKRRRDDDFDVNSFKRRAVSPCLSLQSSPVLGQSPVSNGGNWPQQPPRKGSRESSTGGASVEPNSAGSTGQQPTPILGPKRVGLQGMTDTNDGLMKMSIE